MQPIHAIALTENVDRWLVNSRQPRILHVFDQACNLINEQGDVLSVVTTEIGNGPFNLVVEELSFLEYLNIESQVSIHEKKLHLEDLTINTAVATLWNPHPNWDALHRQQNQILHQLKQLQIADYEFDLNLSFSNSLLPNLCDAVARADISIATKFARQLAGLGMGLTPAGDDILMGAMYAAWIIHPHNVAVLLAQAISNAAAALTTSLSAAWLMSAAQGQAGFIWHEFFGALISGKPVRIQAALDMLLAVGASSGADALAGFTNTFGPRPQVRK